jgi:hypothetical protein
MDKGAFHCQGCCQRHCVGQRHVLRLHPDLAAAACLLLLLLLPLLLPVLLQRHLKQHARVARADGEGGHGAAQLGQRPSGRVQRTQRHQACVRCCQQASIWCRGEWKVVHLQRVGAGVGGDMVVGLGCG